MKQYLNDNRGFTLIEIMVVIVILSLLAVLVTPKIINRVDDAKVTSTKVQIKDITSGLNLYKLDSGSFPSTEQGLEALISKPTTGTIPRNWKEGGYLDSKSIPKDSWGNPYLYLSPGEHGDYDLCSLGADGTKGGEGKNADICNWDMK